MDDGSGVPALTAIGVVVVTVLRIVYRLDRFERAAARRRRHGGRVSGAVVSPARSGPPHPMALPGGWPQHLRVLFSRAVRLAVERGFVTPLMLQRRLGVDVTDAMRLVWALENTGAVGARDASTGQAVTLVRAEQLPAFFAYWGVVEDAPPPQDAPPPDAG